MSSKGANEGNLQPMPNPLKPSMSNQGPLASPAAGRQEAIEIEDYEVAPLIEEELQVVHNRSKTQTYAIITQTVLLTFIGICIIAGIVVISLQFQELNGNLNSLATTGKLARPLLKDATNIGSTFSNLTSGLGNGLGLTGNNSIASGVKDFGNQLVDAGKSLFGQLQDGISDLTGAPPNSSPPSPSGNNGDVNQQLFGPNG